MNLALWLERAGKSHGTQPAVGLGDRVVRDYAELAGRAAGSPRVGSASGCNPVTASPSPHNSIDYLEVLYAVWHAGLAAVPANAKLHRRRARLYPGAFAGARCFARPTSRRRRGAGAGDAGTLVTSAARTTRRCSRPMPRRRAARSRTISPGCSTRRAPPAGPRARC